MSSDKERDEIDKRIIEGQKLRDESDRIARENSVDYLHKFVGVFGERTKIAEFLITLGSFSFGAGLLLSLIHWMMPSMVGVGLAQGLLGGGLACLAFVYFFKAFFYMLLLAAVLILANAGGKSPDGFSISSIPIQAYFAALGMVAVAFILRAVLSQRE